MQRTEATKTAELRSDYTYKWHRVHARTWINVQINRRYRGYSALYSVIVEGLIIKWELKILFVDLHQLGNRKLQPCNLYTWPQSCHNANFVVNESTGVCDSYDLRHLQLRQIWHHDNSPFSKLILTVPPCVWQYEDLTGFEQTASSRPPRSYATWKVAVWHSGVYKWMIYVAKVMMIWSESKTSLGN